MDRRRFMKLSLSAGALVVTYQSSAFFFALKTPEVIEDDYPFDFLTMEDRKVLLAIIPVVLGNSLTFQHSAKKPNMLDVNHNELLKKDLKSIIRGWDTTIIHLAPDTQDEIRQLLDTIQGHPLFRKIILAPQNFNNPKEIDTFLNEWAKSLDHIIVKNELRYAYLAFCNITTSSWYALERSWPTTGYRGAPTL